MPPARRGQPGPTNMRPTAAPLLMVFAAVAALAAGCDAPSYTDGAAFAPGAITSRSAWTASGPFDRPAAAIDGDRDTVAVADAGYGNSALTLDLGGVCMLNMLIMDHGRWEGGFPRRVALLTSMDGRTYTKQAEVPGTRRVTFICTVAPFLARYVRVQAVEAGEGPWTLAEVQVQ